MRFTVLTLIGFSVFTLCTSICPMDMSSPLREHGAGQEMHMASMDMDHGDRAPCEHCAEHPGEELAMIHTLPSVSHAVTMLAPFIAWQAPHIVEYGRVTVPKSHPATAGPHIVPDLVRTIVLRT